MDRLLKVAVVLTAVDQMTRIIGNACDRASADFQRMQKSFDTGKSFLATGAAITMSLAPAVEKFSELEDAATDLETAMLDSAGRTAPEFAKIANLAEKLGDKLPGTTADFDKLFKVMLTNGLDAKSILDGTGKSAAYLGVALEMPYDAAGKFAAKMKEATGTANEDMMAFMDTIARIKNVGVDVDEMQYAFGRSAGALKLLNLQGLEASKGVAAVYAQLIRAGMSGETVGTGFASVANNLLNPKKYAAMKAAAMGAGVDLKFFDKGTFLGMDNFVAQLDKLRGLSAGRRASIVNALTGGGQDGMMLQTLIQNGVPGLQKMNNELSRQADLNTKVEKRLGTLKSIWEATTGTIDNMMAALGAGIAPELKKVGALFGTVASAVKGFLQANPAFAKFIGLTIAATGVFVSVLGVIRLVRGAFIALRVVMLANPFILIATVAIMAIALIYSNWGKIKDFFANLWNGVKNAFLIAWSFIKKILWDNNPIVNLFRWWWKVNPWFRALWEGVKNLFVMAWAFLKKILWDNNPVVLIFKNWDKVKEFFGGLWTNVKNTFLTFVGFVFGLGARFMQAGKNIVSSIWKGIKAMAHKPIEAIRDITKKMRDYLPFSPAKEGALRDIHRVRIVETIADSMKPAPMLRAIGRVTRAARQAIGSPAGYAPAPAYGAAMAGGSTFHVTFAPTIHGGDTSDILGQLRKQIPALARMLQDEYDRAQRRRY